jgi:hypothetical protein
MVMFADPSGKPAAASKATDAEAAQLCRTMVAYAGRYTLEGGKVSSRGIKYGMALISGASSK